MRTRESILRAHHAWHDLAVRLPNLIFQSRSRLHVLAAHCARGVSGYAALLRNGGRREDRVTACTRDRRAKEFAQARVDHRYSGISPAFPAQWFTAYFVLFPVNQRLPPSPTRCDFRIVASLAPAWARQNHTTSPSAKAPLVFRRFRVHRIPASRLVTIARRPSASEAGWREQYAKSEILKSRIYLHPGLDRVFGEHSGRTNRGASPSRQFAEPTPE